MEIKMMNNLNAKNLIENKTINKPCNYSNNLNEVRNCFSLNDNTFCNASNPYIVKDVINKNGYTNDFTNNISNLNENSRFINHQNFLLNCIQQGEKNAFPSNTSNNNSYSIQGNFGSANNLKEENTLLTNPIDSILPAQNNFLNTYQDLNKINDSLILNQNNQFRIESPNQNLIYLNNINNTQFRLGLIYNNIGNPNDFLQNTEMFLGNKRINHKEPKTNFAYFDNISNQLQQNSNNMHNDFLEEKYETTKMSSYPCNHSSYKKDFPDLVSLKHHRKTHSVRNTYICKIDNCLKKFNDKSHLRFHENNSHLNSEKNLPIKCKHYSCSSRFKTKKQNLVHHNYLEPECKNDRELSIKLLREFKKTFIGIINKKNISNKELNLDNNYNKLKNFYETVEEKVIDQDFFFCNLGENFNFLPK